MEDELEVEYGPTPEAAEHEHTDIEPAVVWRFALWLTASIAISAAIVYGTFWFFEGREQTASRAVQTFPLAAGQVKEPPAPHLQTQPYKDIYLLRQGEMDKLTTYGWIDKGTGVVRIPIEDAMRLVRERGVLATPPEAPSELDMVVMDSSAGRTRATR